MEGRKKKKEREAHVRGLYQQPVRTAREENRVEFYLLHALKNLQ